MTTAMRLMTLTLILSLTAGGPLAPAFAQQPAQPARRCSTIVRGAHEGQRVTDGTRPTTGSGLVTL